MNRRQRKQRARERKAVGPGDAPRKQQGDKFESQIPRRDPHSAEVIASSQRAQRSDVHETTDDAATSLARDARTAKSRAEGGAGAGIPDGGTDLRMGDQIPRAVVEPDRTALFPGWRRDRDESDFGGPARIETDERGRLKE